MSESDNQHSFIREHITGKNGRRRWLRRLLKLVGSAAVFGLVAVCVAVAARPAAERWFGTTEEPTTQAPVTLGRDEIPETTPAPTTPAPTTKAPTTEAPTEAVTTEAVEEIVQSVMEDYKYSIDDLNTLWANVSALCEDVDDSVVTVKAVTSGTDWFDNSLASEGTYSGIVIAENSVDVMILTMYDAVREADELIVEWVNSIEQPASVRATDELTGLAVISCSKRDMTDAVKHLYTPLEMGNSYTLRRGDMMIAVGSPRKVAHSTAYMWNSYISRSAETVDNSVRILFSNVGCDAEKGSWILNTKGQLVGWATDRYRTDAVDAATVVACTSDYKALIEKMINRQPRAYIGLTAVTVTNELQNEGMPAGIYITAVSTDGPAYEAGIQPGDILTGIGEHEIASIADYKKLMEDLKPGEEQEMTIYREGREEYKEIRYTLTIGERN